MQYILRCCWYGIIIGFGCLNLIIPDSVDAAPVAGKIFRHIQPDGTRIQVRIWGDEFYRVVESLDGFTLVRDPKSGFACYARLSKDGNELVSTGIAAGIAEKAPADLKLHIRINPAAAQAQVRSVRERIFAKPEAGRTTESITIGAVKGICLLIDFSDDPATIAAAEVDRFCNLAGYTGWSNNGSVRDYFYDVSEGRLTYTNYVPASYYRAAQPKTYYVDPNISFGTRARELIIEALTSLNNQGFDFSQYDSNHDGAIDALNCFYAGDPDSAWATGLWPHAWSVSFSADGVHTDSYQMTNMGTSLALATFCHENGHMLCGWPDLYDYDYDSTGVGRFCLMCYGTTDTNPCKPCAYLRYIAGWSNTLLLTIPQSGLNVPSTTNQFYRFSHPTSTNEFYMVENRQKIGRDSGLPADGLAIWHIDTSGSNNNQQRTPGSHYLVTLVQADGQWDLENNRNYGDSTDLWKAPTYTACTPNSSPNTNWWSGGISNLFIQDISTSGTNMTFTYLNSPDCNGNSIPDTQDIANGTSPDCNTNGIPDECERTPPTAPAATASDACANAQPICPGGVYLGTTIGATNDAAISCASSTSTADVWYRYTPSTNGTLKISLCGSGYDTALSIHSGCPGTTANTLACNDDSCGQQSEVTLSVTAGVTSFIRVSGWQGASGTFQLQLTGPYCYVSGTGDCNGNHIPDQAEPDSDVDGVIDDCDLCVNTPHCARVTASGCSTAPGDFDLDTDVDLDDFAHLQTCLKGPGIIQNDPACLNARLNNDQYVDSNDVRLFIQCMSGMNIAADTNCAK